MHPRQFQVAIVGAGPAGFYTAQQLLKLFPSAIPNSSVKVTMFEKRIAPFGLVRYGVAPDHPEVKNATSKFEAIAKDIGYVGNAAVGNGNASFLKVEELQKAFDAVVFCTGSGSDKILNIPGEDVAGNNVWSCKDFVGWYNGDPDCASLEPNLFSGDTAVIIGQGNVALDCARLLLSPIKDNLEKTDIAEHALKALRKKSIKHVYIVGRRGVLQASFTSKEIRELMSLPNTQFRHDSSMIPEIEKNATWLSKNRPKNRLMTMLAKESVLQNSQKSSENDVRPILPQSWTLRFLSAPTAIKAGSKGEITGVELEENELISASNSNPLEAKVKGTGRRSLLPCSLLIKCIGYNNVPISSDIPFDEKLNIVPNFQGRIISTSRPSPDSLSSAHEMPHTLMPGLYVAGWIKTGPVGVLTSTLFDATETARSIVEDLKRVIETAGSKEKNGRCMLLYFFIRNGKNVGVDDLVKQSHWITFEDWLEVDQVERKRGALMGKEREKVVNHKEMFDLAKGIS